MRAPASTLTVDGELDGGLRAGVQAAVVGQASVSSCVGTAGAADGVGRPCMDLRVVVPEPCIVTRGVGCSQATQSHFFLLAGPKTLFSEAQWLHGNHRIVWTIWRARKACHPSPIFIPHSLT